MKYELLGPQDRKAQREQLRVSYQARLKDLEQQHYQQELEFRLAAALPVPDQARMDTARAAQAGLDAEYNRLKSDHDAIGA